MPVGGGNEVKILVTIQDNATKKIKGVGTSAEKSGKQAQNSFAKMAKSISPVQLGVAGLVTAVAGVGIKSGLSFLEFDRSMTKINTLVGISREQVDAWSDDIKGISAATATGPAELADALFVVTSAGARGADAMAILESAAKASAVGLGRTSDIAKALTSAVNVYGSETLSASKATDILTATVRAGNLGADEMAASLGQVLPVAQSMGVSFEEAGAFIATYTKSGVSAGQASTALRSTLASLLKPTKEAADALADVGLTTDELKRSIKERGLAATLIDLRQRFGDNQEGLSKVIPQVEGLTAVLALSGKQAGDYTKILDVVSDSTGLAGKAFEDTADSAAFKFDEAMNNLQVLLTDLGSKIIPKVIPAVEAIGEAILDLTDFIDDAWPVIEFLGKAFFKVTELWLKPVIIVIQNVVKAIGWLRDTWKDAVNDIIGFAEAAINAMLWPINKLIEGYNSVASFFKQKTIPELEVSFGRLTQSSRATADDIQRDVDDIIGHMGGIAETARQETTPAVDEFGDVAAEVDRILREAAAGGMAETESALDDITTTARDSMNAINLSTDSWIDHTDEITNKYTAMAGDFRAINGRLLSEHTRMVDEWIRGVDDMVDAYADGINNIDAANVNRGAGHPQYAAYEAELSRLLALNPNPPASVLNNLRARHNIPAQYGRTDVPDNREPEPVGFPTSGLGSNIPMRQVFVHGHNDTNPANRGRATSTGDAVYWDRPGFSSQLVGNHGDLVLVMDQSGNTLFRGLVEMFDRQY